MSPPARSSLFRRLGLVALLAVIAPAAGLPGSIAPARAAPQAAPIPVALPSGQSAEEWAPSLAARGLVASTSYGLPVFGVGVSVIDRQDYWEMTVRSHAGRVETVNVAPCTTAEEREDLLFYMSTLLGPAPVVEPTVVEPAVVEPAVVEPAAVTPPPVATATTTGTGGGAVEVPKPRVDRSSEARTGFWVGAGGGVGIRSAAGVVGDLRIDAGWYITPGIRIGAGFSGRTTATLAEGRTMSDLDLVAEAAWAPPKKVAPLIGLYAGGASRGFKVADAPVTRGLLPIVGAEVGVQIPLGSLPIRLEPAVRVQGDLRPIELRSEAGVTPLSPIEVRAGLTLVYRPG